ncbi:phosphotransferase family protein [Streptomyces sp. NPDC096132]|uniref:phosphotransferase family protein n=1 Tax=Streptomyces sp. NPDC096132 TaxID=3366075 RepID=UPI00380FBA55
MVRRRGGGGGDRARTAARLPRARGPSRRLAHRPGDGTSGRADHAPGVRAGTLGPQEAGAVLARLLRELHAVPGRLPDAPGLRVLHLDLHPDNVILTADGPRVIDWGTAEDGEPGLDWGMSSVILAQVAVSADPVAAPAHAILASLLADPSRLTEEGLAEALRRRAANPTMSREEVGLLGAAGELIRSFAS